MKSVTPIVHVCYDKDNRLTDRHAQDNNYHNYSGLFWGMHILQISQNENFREDCTYEVTTLCKCMSLRIRGV